MYVFVSHYTLLFLRWWRTDRNKWLLLRNWNQGIIKWGWKLSSFLSSQRILFHVSHGKTNIYCRTRHRSGLKNLISWKRMDFWHPILWWWMVLFKESPPSIMVTRNPNWSTEILWYETGYVKGKILSSLKRPA